MKRTKILIFNRAYLPGYKAGGPIQTLANMVEAFHEKFELYIVTADRDFGDSKAYDGIEVDKWNHSEKVSIFYLSPQNRTYSFIKNLVHTTDHDILYLNSFFDLEYTLFPLFATKRKSNYSAKIILAPRGEFSIGALN
jgi:hypothetical protein